MMDRERGASSEDVRFLFPTVDGGELTSRWDMQETPPDLLITNVSMLNAILAREVDSPILDRTRDWLTSDDDAYFSWFSTSSTCSAARPAPRRRTCCACFSSA